MSRPVTRGQAATISPEAADYLRAVPSIPLPRFLFGLITGPRRVPSFRRQFQAGEDKIELELIREHDLTLEQLTLGGVPVLRITPPELDPELADVVAFNIHGGGFILGTARERNALLAAAELRIPVYSVDYTLAPEAAYPVAIDESLRAYQGLLKRHDGEHIVGMGSSAGGTLLLAMVQRLQAAGLPVPRALMLYTPAGDISGAGDSAVVNSDRDLQPTEIARQLAARNYIRDADPKDPGVSPLYGEFRPGWPATVMTTGTRDIMLSNVVRLFWKLREAGAPTELLIEEGMWHGFTWEPTLPEAVRTRRAAAEFIRAQFQ